MMRMSATTTTTAAAAAAASSAYPPSHPSTNNILNDNPAVFRPLLSQMDIILKTMPAEETRSFFEALRVVPHLVVAETDPVKFLRSLDMNPALAAQRIAKYWQVRCQLFGDRAFRPLISTSNGALNERDRDFLLSGIVVLLPNDARGRTVLCSDDTRRLEFCTAVQTRVFFYLDQIISENYVSQTEGFVLLKIFCGEQKQNEDSIQKAGACFQVFPYKMAACHLLDVTPHIDGVSEFEASFGAHLKGLPSPIHRYKRKRDYASALAAFGFAREGLPRSIGGTWCYRQFVKWQNDRIRLERRMYPAPASRLDINGVSRYLNSNDEEEIEDEESSDKDPLYNHRRLLQEAILQVPDSDKEAYLEARQLAPEEIRENEASIDWFLLVEELNCWLAAGRLARYWKLRAEIFGDKKFCALNQTGEAAFSKNDLHVLHTGFIVLLPADRKGSPVVSIDCSRLETSGANTPDQNIIEKWLFYMFSILAENEESQTNGAVLLWKLQEGMLFPDTMASYLERLVDCLPVRLKAVHVLCPEGDGAVDKEQLESQLQFADDVYVHAVLENNKEELVSKLEYHGIDRLNLPKQIGGKWAIDKFYQWQELRTRFEWKLPLGLSGRSDSAEAFRFPAVKSYRALSEEDKIERKRRLDVIHSRRKRDRVKVEIEVLNEHTAELREEQSRLMTERQRLESLLRSAFSTIGLKDDTSSTDTTPMTTADETL